MSTFAVRPLAPFACNNRASTLTRVRNLIGSVRLPVASHRGAIEQLADGYASMAQDARARGLATQAEMLEQMSRALREELHRGSAGPAGRPTEKGIGVK